MTKRPTVTTEGLFRYRFYWLGGEVVAWIGFDDASDDFTFHATAATGDETFAQKREVLKILATANEIRSGEVSEHTNSGRVAFMIGRCLDHVATGLAIAASLVRERLPENVLDAEERARQLMVEAHRVANGDERR